MPTPKTRYQAAWNARQTPPPPGDPRHGKNSTYVNYRCRCEKCRDAARLVARNRAAGIRPVRGAA